MDEDRMATMAEATRLTREGRLSEATTLIQRTMGSPAPGSTVTGARSPSRPAGREAGDGDAAGIDRVPVHDLPGDPRDEGWFPAPGDLVVGLEPVPVLHAVCR